MSTVRAVAEEGRAVGVREQDEGEHSDGGEGCPMAIHGVVRVAQSRIVGAIAQM
jgi:hypothetical protein